MDTTHWLGALGDEFVRGDVTAGAVVDRGLADLVREVPGFTTPSELAVLRSAARHMPGDETYLEVGTFKGRSICAAMMDAPGGDFVAVENFQEFGMVGEDARRELLDHVRERGEGRRLRLVDGDCFDVLARPGLVEKPVGVYFYDGAHTGLAHWLALAVAEPLLADEALVLIDDASWPMVRRATERYIAARPEWEVLLDLRARCQDDPIWANGLLVLRHRRRDQGSGLTVGARLLRRFQVHMRGPATGLIWRALHRFPQLVPLAKRLVPKRSRSVPPAGSGAELSGGDMR